jgi:hypothetical protein
MNPFLANVVIDLFIRGGPIMWPILICLVSALIVVVERTLWWWSLQRRVRDDARWTKLSKPLPKAVSNRRCGSRGKGTIRFWPQSTKD